MNIDKLYESLDGDKNPNTLRVELISFLKECIKSLTENENERQSVAYNIAGLLSTNYARTLSNTDLLDNVLTLSSELEIAGPDNDKKWALLIDMINQL